MAAVSLRGVAAKLKFQHGTTSGAVGVLGLEEASIDFKNLFVIAVFQVPFKVVDTGCVDGPWSENSDEISFTDDVARVNGLPVAKTARARQPRGTQKNYRKSLNYQKM